MGGGAGSPPRPVPFPPASGPAREWAGPGGGGEGESRAGRRAPRCLRGGPRGSGRRATPSGISEHLPASNREGRRSGARRRGAQTRSGHLLALAAHAPAAGAGSACYPPHRHPQQGPPPRAAGVGTTGSPYRRCRSVAPNPRPECSVSESSSSLVSVKFKRQCTSRLGVDPAPPSRGTTAFADAPPGSRLWGWGAGGLPDPVRTRFQPRPRCRALPHSGDRKLPVCGSRGGGCGLRVPELRAPLWRPAAPPPLGRWCGFAAAAGAGGGDNGAEGNAEILSSPLDGQTVRLKSLPSCGLPQPSRPKGLMRVPFPSHPSPSNGEGRVCLRPPTPPTSPGSWCT